MRAVWSFWSKPFRSHYGSAWGTPLNHSLAWVVSVLTAARHYPDTLLVTDSAGARMLVDQLGLPFAAVSTELDRLHRHDPGWWMLGKLVAYARQETPFVHIDTDAFLWKPLPDRLATAPVLAQHPEHYGPEQDIYRPQDVEHAFAETGGIIPTEWQWARSQAPGLSAENCGILGGCDIGFLRHYAETALALVERPENAAGWMRHPHKWRFTYVVEQFLLSACIGYHRAHPHSPHQGVRCEYLFRSWDEARNPNHAAKAGYTHLMADSKRAPDVMRRLAYRVRRDWPEYYRRCVRRAQLPPVG
jgi:Family of unknown function (DUF6734)